MAIGRASPNIRETVVIKELGSPTFATPLEEDHPEGHVVEVVGEIQVPRLSLSGARSESEVDLSGSERMPKGFRFHYTAVKQPKVRDLPPYNQDVTDWHFKLIEAIEAVSKRSDCMEK